MQLVAQGTRIQRNITLGGQAEGQGGKNGQTARQGAGNLAVTAHLAEKHCLLNHNGICQPQVGLVSQSTPFTILHNAPSLTTASPYEGLFC